MPKTGYYLSCFGSRNSIKMILEVEKRISKPGVATRAGILIGRYMIEKISVYDQSAFELLRLFSGINRSKHFA